MEFLSAISKNFSGQTCLLRVDFNVASAQNSLRLEAVLPTIKFLLKKKAKIIILSHRGRPNRKLTPVERKKLSLQFVVPFLQKELKENVILLPDILSAIGLRWLVSDSHLRQGFGGQAHRVPIVLLENLRFWPGEEKNDLAFARKLAPLGDFCVNDAFAVCHRHNASVTQLPKLLPSYGGLLLEKEIKALSGAMKKPRKPLVVIFGGAKVQDKMSAIKNLLPKASTVLLGSSAMQSPNLKHLQKSGLLKSPKVIKPMDWLGDKNGQPLDIGPMTVDRYISEIKKAKTIIWNGPVGYFEDNRFAAGSEAIARAIARSQAKVIIGGGETVAFFQSATRGLTQTLRRLTPTKTPRGPRPVRVSLRVFLSTGGGAMLEFLSGRVLPGIKALN